MIFPSTFSPQINSLKRVMDFSINIFICCKVTVLRIEYSQDLLHLYCCNVGSTYVSFPTDSKHKNAWIM